jgi:iron complex transport system substrate-binding protein
MTHPMIRIAPIILTVIALLAAPEMAAGKPRRIVSLYLCADELVLQLAEQKNIASVSFLARDPDNSNVAALAARTPVNAGHAEEIVAQRPDMVLAGVYTTRPAVALLKRTGVPLIELGVPRSLDDVRHDIRAVAKAIDETEIGARMVAAIDARLAALPSPQRNNRPSAFILNPNGFATGAGSLADEILAHAGFENRAATLGINNYGQLPLEVLIRSGVDLVIFNADRDGPPSLATDFLHHPAFEILGRRTRMITLPSRLWTCGGPAIVEAIERLALIASELRPAEARR